MFALRQRLTTFSTLLLLVYLSFAMLSKSGMSIAPSRTLPFLIYLQALARVAEPGRCRRWQNTVWRRWAHTRRSHTRPCYSRTHVCSQHWQNTQSIFWRACQAHGRGYAVRRGRAPSIWLGCASWGEHVCRASDTIRLSACADATPELSTGTTARGAASRHEPRACCNDFWGHCGGGWGLGPELIWRGGRVVTNNVESGLLFC